MNIKNYLDKNKQDNSKQKTYFQLANYETLANEVGQRTYYEQYKNLYYFAYVLIFLAQFASAFSSFAFVHSFVSYKVSAEFSGAVSVLILVIIEISKFYLYTVFLRQFFQRVRKFEPSLFLATLLISCFSFYASISGALELGQNKELLTNTSEMFADSLSKVEQSIKQDIANINTQINSVQKDNAFKQVVWVNGRAEKILSEAGKSQIARLQSEKEKLMQRLENKEQTLQAESRKAKQAIQITNQKNGNTYSWFFGSFEVIFITLSFWVWHFKRQSIISFELSEIENEPLDNLSESSNEGTNRVRTEYEPFKPNPKVLPVGFELPKLSANRVRTEYELEETNKKTVEPKKLESTNPVRTKYELSESENKIFTELYEKAQTDSKSVLANYPYTTLAVYEGKSWKFLNESTKWNECGRTTYYTIKRIIEEINKK